MDRALVARREGFRNIATRFRLSLPAVYRHYCEHLPETLARAAEDRETARGVDLLAELEACLARLRLLADACDRWLRDPEDPTQFDIGPRSEDVKVTYWEPGVDGRRTRRRKRLSELLALVEGAAPDVAVVEVKHADPRTLLPKAAAQIGALVELLARLVGKLKTEGATVNVFLSAEWHAARAAILGALAPYPAAREQVAAALAALDGAHRSGNGAGPGREVSA